MARRSRSKDKQKKRHFSNEKELIAHLKKVGLEMVIEHPEEEESLSNSSNDSPVKSKICNRDTSEDSKINRKTSLSQTKMGSIRKQFEK